MVPFNEEGKLTSIQPLFQFLDFYHGAAYAIYALEPEPVLLNSLAAFDHDGRYVHIITSHLLSKVNTESRPTFVHHLGVRRAG